MTVKSNLKRFLDAQERYYDIALSEIRMAENKVIGCGISSFKYNIKNQEEHHTHKTFQ